MIIAVACVDMGIIRGFASMEPTGHEIDAVLIAVGVLIIIVAAFGCFGAWKESPKLLYIVSFYFLSFYIFKPGPRSGRLRESRTFTFMLLDENWDNNEPMKCHPYLNSVVFVTCSR